MARLIKKTSKNYTNVSNSLVRDKRLSWKARGIFVYLWSQADNWNFYVGEIAKHSIDGKRALQGGIKELESYGYLKRKPHNKDTGGFDGMDWILTDSPERQVQNSVDAKKGQNTEKMVQNSVDAEKAQNQGKMVQNTSDAKRIQCETHPMQNAPLRNNNNKNYQEEEISIERKQTSPAKPDTLPQRQEIIGYLNSKLGTHYKPSSSATKKHINARLKEGYTVDDFKQVIDTKVASWKSDDRMSQYLRPQTLFNTNFESYLNEIKPKPQEKDWSSWEDGDW